MHDVCIVGGGPAGLSAALVLGRCRRDVLVLDSGRPRNGVSRGLHGFLTRDGVSPAELRALGRGELARYPTVQVRDLKVTAAQRFEGGFELRLSDGLLVHGRILLLATGRDDLLPRRPGFSELYGRGVYHCPICDGWEHRDQPMVAYGCGTAACELAVELLTWSAQVALCSDGPCRLSEAERGRLKAKGIPVIETEIDELGPGADGMLDRIRFSDGGTRTCRALFFVSDCPQKSSLPEKLGCTFAPSGGVACTDHAATNVPGLFVAGNVRCGLHLAITAAAEGAEAAVAINEALAEADLK